MKQIPVWRQIAAVFIFILGIPALIGLSLWCAKEEMALQAEDC